MINTTIKILVVDDSKSFLAGLSLYFRYSEEITLVKTALNGAECLEFLNTTAVDIILMDIRMETPKAGIITAEKIQKNNLSKAKIIFLTAEYDKRDIEKALMMNCSFIDKACSVPHIIALIKRIYFEDKLIIESQS